MVFVRTVFGCASHPRLGALVSNQETGFICIVVISPVALSSPTINPLADPVPPAIETYAFNSGVNVPFAITELASLTYWPSD